MADEAKVKISELPAASAITGAELVPVVQGGTTKKVAVENLAPGLDMNSTSTTLGVAKGGTGATSLTDHGVLLGSGAGAVTPAAAMTNGQLLVGATGADPAPQTVSGALTLASNGAATLATAGVTYALIQNIGALAVAGRSANTSGVGADIAAVAASGAVLRESGSTIGFGTLATAGLAAGAVTKAKANVALSTEITANGTPQNYAHGLTGTPSVVLVVATDTTNVLTGYATSWTADGTNVAVTGTADLKYRVFAWA